MALRDEVERDLGLYLKAVFARAAVYSKSAHDEAEKFGKRNGGDRARLVQLGIEQRALAEAQNRVGDEIARLKRGAS